MNELMDPRLVEIEILGEIDRATFGGSYYRYDYPGSRGVREQLIHEAIVHLAFDGAVMDNVGYRSSGASVVTFPDPRPLNPTFALDAAAKDTVGHLLAAKGYILLQITQRGRLRLYRLRDEILNRDRIRDDFGILWAKRHWLPDLEVRLRFRQPTEALSLIWLDVDRLKLINTTFAHAGADEVLRGIFEILRDKVQPAEAYRLGGDEAGAILLGVDRVGAGKVAEDIRTTVERTFADRKMVGDITPTVTLAVGTATNSMGAEDFDRRVGGHLTAKKDQGGLRNAVHVLEDGAATV